MPQFINFRGRAVRQGLITKMFEEAAKLDLGALEKISSASSPKEFAEAMCAVNKAVARLADATDAYVGNKRIGTDDVVGISGLAMGILFARLGDKKLHELKTAFRSENAAKVAELEVVVVAKVVRLETDSSAVDQQFHLVLVGIDFDQSLVALHARTYVSTASASKAVHVRNNNSKLVLRHACHILAVHSFRSLSSFFFVQEERTDSSVRTYE